MSSSRMFYIYTWSVVRTIFYTRDTFTWGKPKLNVRVFLLVFLYDINAITELFGDFHFRLSKHLVFVDIVIDVCVCVFVGWVVTATICPWLHIFNSIFEHSVCIKCPVICVWFACCHFFPSYCGFFFVFPKEIPRGAKMF